MSIVQVKSLEIIQVGNHGVPNHEHIAIYVEEHCDLSEFCILVGLAGLDGYATPVKDHMLWFGHELVNPGDWILVYTAAGSTRISPTPADMKAPPGARVISIHWGKDHTIFQNRSLVPMIVQIAAIGLEEQPAPQFQGIPKGKQRRLL